MMSSTYINDDESFTVHTKGASEIVSKLCSYYLDSNGNVATMDEKQLKMINDMIDEFASNGERTLALAFRNIPSTDKNLFENRKDIEKDLIFIALVGIEDPLRPEVIQAVQQCKDAGITVRMVTGDNIKTAKSIAIKAGILFGDGFAIEGDEFREKTTEELDMIIPKLQVLARSTPTDKYILVKRLKQLGEVVAVTGKLFN
jgi:Ca2+-transporting ATPase